MFRSSAILIFIVKFFNPTSDVDGEMKGKIAEPAYVEPFQCSTVDACNMCQSEAFNDHCLTCLP